MRLLEWLWSWAPDILGARRFGALVRSVLLLVALVGVAIPNVRSSVFAWLVAQEAARLEPAVRAGIQVVRATVLGSKN